MISLKHEIKFPNYLFNLSTVFSIWTIDYGSFEFFVLALCCVSSIENYISGFVCFIGLPSQFMSAKSQQLISLL